MNPAEEIVKYWLQSKGYFLQSSIRLPKNKEIDILVMHPETSERLHVEVSVSVRMANYKENAQELAKGFYENKFLAIQDKVASRLGDSYKKQLVVGRVSFKNKNIREEFVKECEKLGVEVLKFEDILGEVSGQLSTHSHLNPVIKTVQLTGIFLERRF